MKHTLLLLLFSLLLFGAACQKPPAQESSANISVNSAQPTSQNTNVRTDDLWKVMKDGTWVSTSTPPPCPDPIEFSSPTDVSKVTAVLYPGQPRDGAYKPHGGFRFSDKEPENKIIVRIPFDAEIIQGSRAFRNNEKQYSFVFQNPCGILYTLGHLLELSPGFMNIANKLPLVEDINGSPPLVQNYPVYPPVRVKAGEILATKVGYAIPHNVFFDFGVVDLRHPNGKTIKQKWKAQYGNQFDRYALCWFDVLPPADAAKLKALPGGAHDSGKESDYCI